MEPADDAVVVQCGPDRTSRSTPFATHRSDLSTTTGMHCLLEMLLPALAGRSVSEDTRRSEIERATSAGTPSAWRTGQLLGTPVAGGLGWALPAMGIRLTQPERTVIATLGNGANLFANAAPCHHAMAMHYLPGADDRLRQPRVGRG